MACEQEYQVLQQCIAAEDAAAQTSVDAGAALAAATDDYAEAVNQYDIAVSNRQAAQADYDACMGSQSPGPPSGAPLPTDAGRALVEGSITTVRRALNKLLGALRKRARST